jgi:transcriptional regulator with XRE-family HTH domain
MNDISLGQKLRQLRESAGFSLRELARETNISAPFLSDIELGRRFPRDETLSLIAKKLRVRVGSLKEHDTRSALIDLKRIAGSTPALGVAFRAMVEQMNAGKLTPGELAAKLRQLYGPKTR